MRILSMIFLLRIISVMGCDNICYGLLREVFVEKPDMEYPRLVQIFYANFKYEGIYITSRIGETMIRFTMKEFGAMCKVPANEKTYNVNAPNDSVRFNHVVAIGSFLIKEIRYKKLSLKTKFMKATCCVMHHLMTHVLFPRKESREHQGQPRTIF
ncbi:unnamed protein product [Vicia faba]|uniref:Uncharacterized protein n=1 Tax=Vicia faba TaxID=3906 RepID=A0AAV1AZ27_VICFA|nr:unnamed protein product [Vicia faba]